jgi:AcrR family transcriptional regulator
MDNMKAATRRGQVRRQPQQQRSRQTVEAVLDAVVRILKRQGIDGVTTNRIAETAGLSIGSVYQYFPDKRAIFKALHDRHADQIGRLVESRLVEHAASALEDRVGALVEAVVEAHAADPELHELLATQVPHGADGAHGLEGRVRGALRLALSSRAEERDLERALFVLPHMVEALSHAAALRRPARLSLAAAKHEAVGAVLAYLRFWRSTLRG